jgi:hypothetical protein
VSQETLPSSEQTNRPAAEAGKDKGGTGWPAPEPNTDFLPMVRGIRAGNASFVRELDTLVSPGILFLLAGAMPSAELADKVHGIVVSVVRRIRDGELDSPDGLLDFVRCVTKEHIAVSLFNLRRSDDSRTRVEPSGGVSPAARDSGAGSDSTILMRDVLRELSPRDREALERYYVLGHSEEAIMADLRMTPVQFRSLKSAVKMRFLAVRANQAPDTGGREDT